jgi:hypothetical protein
MKKEARYHPNHSDHVDDKEEDSPSLDMQSNINPRRSSDKKLTGRKRNSVMIRGQKESLLTMKEKIRTSMISSIILPITYQRQAPIPWTTRASTGTQKSGKTSRRSYVLA